MTTKKTNHMQKPDARNAETSVSPSGEVFRLPDPADYEKELSELEVVAGKRLFQTAAAADSAAQHDHTGHK
jgi:hypothetical protein